MSMHSDSDRRWWLCLVLAMLVVLAINPAGYIGGGLDDWQYLNAARCWANFGPCLPHDHWQGRWPVFAPIASITALFGESRVTVSIAPLLASTGALCILALIGNRLCGKPVGWIAALLLLATPSFAFQLTEPSVESVELFFIFAGTLAIIEWQTRRKPGVAFVAGMMLSLAIQVRETAAVAVIFLGMWALARRDRPSLNHFAWALAGFGVPFLVEFLIFWLSTGDPFWRRRLSIAHTRIVSSELLGPIDSTRPPFFNKAYIANWRMEPGIHVHWSIDGILNLFANVGSGLSLTLTPLLLVTYRAVLPADERRSAFLFWIVGLLYCFVLIYAFAIDPKPRMMLAALSLTNVALALLTVRLFKQGKMAMSLTIWLVVMALGIAMQYSRPRGELMEASARQWIDQHPGQIETDLNTQRHLALAPEASTLPPVIADRPYYLTIGNRGCSYFLLRTRLSGALQIVASAPASRLGQYFHKRSEVCLFRYRKPIDGGTMSKIIEEYVDGEARQWAAHPTLGTPDL